jgi:hypothetical protein
VKAAYFSLQRKWRPDEVTAQQQGFCSCVGTAHFDLRLAERGLKV